jgi:hypothetical protein
MKKLFWGSWLLAFTFLVLQLNPAFAEAETKRVCVDVKDKDGKVAKDAKGNAKQSCRDVKQHKKLEGTKVPEKK